MAESMKDLVDPDKLQGQLSSALQTTIQTVMETYSDQITEVLKSQLDAAIQKGIVTFQDQIQSQLKTAIQQNIGKLSSQMESAIKIDASAFQKAIQLNMTASELTELMRSTLRSSSATYEANLTAFGYADEAAPARSRSIRRTSPARPSSWKSWMPTTPGCLQRVKTKRWCSTPTSWVP